MLEYTPRSLALRRTIASFGGLLVGGFVGSVTTVVHQNTVDILSIELPWGMMLGLFAITGFLVGLRIVVQDRLVVLAGALGILVMIFILSQRSAGGSVLVPNNLWGTIWAIAPTLIATFVVAWPKLPARARGGSKPATASD